MNRNKLCLVSAFAVMGTAVGMIAAQTQPAATAFQAASRPAGTDSTHQTLLPDPKEIPVPEIKTAFPRMPGVNELPDHPEMPDIFTMNDGTKVTTPEQWARRRIEMRNILEYYALGHAPPPPGNVKGKVMSEELQNNGQVKYRLVHLTFGPEEKLTLDFGIYTPTTGGPFPTIISAQPGPPPGGQQQPKLNAGPNPAEGDLLAMEPGSRGAVDGGRGGRGGPPGRGRGRGRGPLGGTPATGTSPAADDAAAAAATTAATGPAGRGGGRGGRGNSSGSPASLAAKGYALVVFNTSDCAEDSRLRLADGSFAFRTTRFFPAYPGYDWGIIRAWGWGASRVVDYLETDPSVDKSKLIITGVSRWGKTALFAGAMDERFAMVAPVASSGGGTPAFRFSGPERGGKEGLTDMMRKYPNQFGPQLHQFWGHIDKLPFDEHWYFALIAPRSVISLEGFSDQNVNHVGVRQSILAAEPAFKFLGVPDHIGVSWCERMHGIADGDWNALVAFADKNLLGKKVTPTFDQYPPTAYLPGETPK